ncbi:guanylate kinase [candidate division TM6 bacterium RIFCSPHIGHO2_12_FULL_36_22]|nr:MAG: guanylate kinase [candidate division TM6 bacterium RIFCSPHIGHO2_12_FULL_36_22]
MKKHKGTLFVISAPSGTGKTTLVNAILSEKGQNEKIEQVVTYTTKKPRNGEINGKSYYFLTKDEFEAKIAQNFFLEWSDVYDNYYGSPRYALDKLTEGISQIAILDRTGAKAVKQIYPPSILIWIETPNIEELAKRLTKRASDSSESIIRRLALAIKEIEAEKVEQLYDYTIINDDFEKAKQALKSILFQRIDAEKTL